MQQAGQNHLGGFTESLLGLPSALTSVRNKTEERKSVVCYLCISQAHSYQKEGYGEILFWLLGLALMLLCVNEDSQLPYEVL